MIAQIAMPPQIVQKALDVLSAKLEAKETKFFSHKGRVTDVKTVEAHGVQLEAVDKVISMAGLYAREREAPTGPAGFEMIVEPNGVLRIRSGAARAIGSGIDSLAPTPDLDRVSVEASPTEAIVMAAMPDRPARTPAPRRIPVPIESMKRVILDEIVD